MAKTIKVVEQLIERAENKGVAICNRNGIQVYRVENDGRYVSLYHYHTLTARFDSVENEMVMIGGYSRSDLDSVATFCEYHYMEAPNRVADLQAAI